MRKRIFRTLVRPLVDRHVYECLTMNWPGTVRSQSGDRAPAVHVKELQHAELARLRNVSALEISEQFVHSLAQRPDRCFAAFVGDALASYVFFSPASPTAIDEHLRFQFPHGWMYVYKAFTVPAWRGKRLLPHLLLEAMSRLQRREFVTLVVSENRNSRKAFERCGFQFNQCFPVWRVLSRPVRVTTPLHAGFCVDSHGSPLAAQV